MRFGLSTLTSFLLCLSVHSVDTKELIIFDLDDLVQKHDARMTSPVDTLSRLAAMYPKTVDEVNNWLEAGMKLAQMEIDAIISIPAESRTFDNTVRALDVARNNVTRLLWTFGMLGCTSPDQELLGAVHNAATCLQQFAVGLYSNPLLYQAFLQYLDLKDQQEILNPENVSLLEDFITMFHQDGCDLPSNVLFQVNQLKEELMQLENDFVVNIDSDPMKVAVSLSELDGLNKKRIETLQKDGEFYVLTIDYPTYFEVMEQCHISNTRYKVFLSFKNCAYSANDVLLKEILKKRDELAKLLGYKNFASFDLEDTMVKNTKNVESFLHDLISATLQKAELEFAELKKNLPQEVVCNADGTLNQWDYLYVVNSYKKKNFDIDEAKIAEYFPVQKVIEGVFTIYQDFLGLVFKEVKPEWSWHEDVRLIEIYRQDCKEFLGYLFLDLYPRPYKSKHIASHYPQVRSFKPEGKNIPTVSVIIANLTKPSADTPALLTHDDVVVFFHEFGHAMHTVLARTEHALFAGTSVKADFVEMPSQMFEEWMFEPNILALISSHYQTGEPLPAELIAKKIALRKFDVGYSSLRTCVLSLFALQLMQDLDSSYDPATLWHNLHDQYFASLISFEEQNHFYTSWWHLAQPYFYASKFYGYTWAKILSMDVFAKIKEQGFDEKSRHQIQKILGAGGSVDPNKLLHDFLGREPNQDAFLEAFGLK